MTEELVRVGKTKTGNLDFNVAGGLCYLPVAYIHLIVAGVWLLAEPRENRFVRFHAMQSLLLFFGFFLGGFAAILGSILLAALVGVLGTVVGVLLTAASEDLGALVTILFWGLSMLIYCVGLPLGVFLILAFLPAFFVTAVIVFTGGSGRWPVVGGFVERFV